MEEDEGASESVSGRTGIHACLEVMGMEMHGTGVGCQNVLAVLSPSC